MDLSTLLGRRTATMPFSPRTDATPAQRQRSGSGGKCLPTPSDSSRTGLAAPALTHTRGLALTAKPWPLTRGRSHQQRLHSTIAPSERPQRSQPAAEEEEGAKQGGNRGGGGGDLSGGGRQDRLVGGFISVLWSSHIPATYGIYSISQSEPCLD